MKKTNVKKKKVAKKKQVRGYRPTGLLSSKPTIYGQHRPDPELEDIFRKANAEIGRIRNMSKGDQEALMVEQRLNGKIAEAEIRYKWAPLVEQLEREKDELVQRLADIMNHHQPQKSIEEIEIQCQCGRTNRIFRIP